MGMVVFSRVSWINKGKRVTLGTKYLVSIVIFKSYGATSLPH